ncbi:monocarboxylate transporter 9-like [Physella acuta]|uniref:monocarboxylate transporter 9-like n=1 Tax=Physella acuta TaxID=109671 RepID=UPI0027DD594E|nr:monocarboxylate transporter 9-like [Physella acuta]XP_059139182.1 monocarboxylate transporter 9-like [Physella acuta]XP_059139183.1 monocarboxylate transporter 9-like [Physella acuta]
MEGGTWGLVIIFSAFMIQFLAFGVTAAIGVYNIELLDYFDGATVGVSLIGSLNYGIFLGSGPIVSFLMTKFSYRKITLFGSFLIVVGLLGMPLLPYIPAMCVTFGVLTGFGCCCAYIPSHVLSGLYYDKYRSLATGVTTSGSGLGGAVMPVVVGLLIEHYTWKTSLVFVAGLCLHLFVFSSLLRDPPADLEIELTADTHPPGGEEVAEDKLVSIPLAPVTDTPCQRMANDDLSFEFGQDLSKLEFVDKLSCRTNMSSIENINLQDTSQNLVYNHCQPNRDSVGKNEIYCEKDSLMLIHRKPQRLPEYLSKHHSLSLNSLHVVGSTRCSNVVVLEKSVDAAPTANNSSDTKLLPNSSRHIFIFTNCAFNIYFCSNIMWNAAGSIVNSFAPEFLRERGLSPMTAAWLSGGFGFGCFIGGILGGVFGNMQCVNRQGLYTLSNLAMGLLLVVFPFVDHIVWYCLLLILTGFAFGIILGLLIIVLTDLIGIESLGNGLGYLMLSNGLGTFIGPPIAGLVRDYTGGFEGGIILAGCLCILGGITMFIMPFRQRCSPKCMLPHSHT